MLKLTMATIPHDTETAMPLDDRLIGSFLIDVSNIGLVQLDAGLLAIDNCHAKP